MDHYPQSGIQKPRLFDRVRQKIQALHYSQRTEKTYIGWIKRFIFFHGRRHPIEMGEKEINEFLSFFSNQEECNCFNTKSSFVCNCILVQKCAE